MRGRITDPVKHVVLPPEDIRRRDAPYSVPRRYGMGTILTVTAVFAAFFGVLTAVGVPAAAIAIVSAFLFLVGLGQMFLFGGRSPRAASVIVGVGVFAVIGAIQLAIGVADGIPEQLLAATQCSCSLMSGALMGYVAGAIDAGVFLVLDAVERWMRSLRPQSTSPQDAESDPFADRARNADGASPGDPRAE